MSGFLEAAKAAGPVFRLARAPDPWAWPDWSHAGLDGTFGNRWDDSEGEYRVLYASSTRFGALLETLAVFRPDLAAVAGLDKVADDADALAPGTVPRERFGHRVMGVAELDGAYADIGAATSLATIRSRLVHRPDVRSRAQPGPVRPGSGLCQRGCGTGWVRGPGSAVAFPSRAAHPC